MELCLPLGLGALALLVLLAVAAAVLIKLGVFVKYATKEELPDPGGYHLDQSHEPDDR